MVTLLWFPRIPLAGGNVIVRGALQQMFERKMAVEQPVKAKIKYAGENKGV